MTYEVSYRHAPSKDAHVRDLSIWVQHPVPQKLPPDNRYDCVQSDSVADFLCPLMNVTTGPFQSIFVHFVPRVPEKSEGSWWRAEDAWWKTFDWESAGLDRYWVKHWLYDAVRAWAQPPERCYKRALDKLRRMEEVNVLIVWESEGVVTCDRVLGEWWKRETREVTS